MSAPATEAPGNVRHRNIEANTAGFRPLIWLAAVFLLVSLATRLALLFAARDGIGMLSLEAIRALCIGFGYDLATLCYFALPLVLVLCLLPVRLLQGRLGHALILSVVTVSAGVLFFVAVAEWTFWEEFQTRFNFIAVDYLVYTTEVIGNIRESYPVGWILTLLCVGLAITITLSRRWLRVTRAAPWRHRLGLLAAWLGAAVLLTATVRADFKDSGPNQYGNELAGNGIYQFFAAFRNSSLDYARFYATLPDDDAYALLREQLAAPGVRFIGSDAYDIARTIDSEGPERKLNVVLISIESLSAMYSGQFGRTPSLTPELDRLAPDTLMFSRLYASGTRTVRGLEALALSVPPTPGESIVKRTGNEGLFSLATVFNRKGYRSEFLYGGYGVFDNMNHFFGSNGYEVHDRADIPDEAIHHANIWGVADEDLYSLALSELDRAHADGKPLFTHVMTTSNHRPYTFPEGRIDAPQGERDSAVRYTDWAIGDFLQRARGKPWFADTVFVITADHCASSGGIAKLPVFRYHIPLWIYAPGLVAPGRIDRMVAQIDIGPTILGLLGLDYLSEFYGVDVLQSPGKREMALIGNYQRLGYLRNDRLVELSPRQSVDSVQPAYDGDFAQPAVLADPEQIREAIAYYQTASDRFHSGRMRLADSRGATAVSER